MDDYTKKNRLAVGKAPSFAPLGTVLTGVMSHLGLDRRLREHTLLNLWPTFVPSRIADRSRPIFIDAQRTLVVAVADAACGQELSLMKTPVLAKMIPTARALGVEIRGFRLNLKHYHQASEDLAHKVKVSRLKTPGEGDLAALVLSSADQAELAALEQDLDAEGSDPAFKAKILKLGEGALRLRQWRTLNGYPVCSACGNPAERLHSLKQAREGVSGALCGACFYSL